MSGPSLPPVPAELKSIEPYLARARELAGPDPAIAYWCNFYALQTGLNKAPSQEAFLLALMDVLEASKATLSASPETHDLVSEDAAAAAYIENFALRTFIRADDADRAGQATKATAQSFLASSYFLNLLTLFPNPPPDLQDKVKYARYRTTQIMSALRAGQTPAPSSPFTAPAALPLGEILHLTDKPSTERGPTPDRPASPSSSTTAGGSTGLPDVHLPEAPSSPVEGGRVGGPPVIDETPPPRNPLARRPSATTSAKTFEIHPPPAGTLTPPPLAPGSQPANPYPSAVSPTAASVPAPGRIAQVQEDESAAGRDMDPTTVAKAQKHARWAISALNYEDRETAVRELRLALETLGA